MLTDNITELDPIDHYLEDIGGGYSPFQQLMRAKVLRGVQLDLIRYQDERGMVFALAPCCDLDPIPVAERAAAVDQHHAFVCADANRLQAHCALLAEVSDLKLILKLPSMQNFAMRRLEIELVHSPMLMRLRLDPEALFVALENLEAPSSALQYLAPMLSALASMDAKNMKDRRAMDKPDPLAHQKFAEVALEFIFEWEWPQIAVHVSGDARLDALLAKWEMVASSALLPPKVLELPEDLRASAAEFLGKLEVVSNKHAGGRPRTKASKPVAERRNAYGALRKLLTILRLGTPPASRTDWLRDRKPPGNHAV